MSEEEFFNRMINQISKVFDGRIATKMKNIYLKKDKQLNKQKEVIDKIKEYIENTDDFDIEIFDENSGGCLGTDLSKGAKHILELLEEIE